MGTDNQDAQHAGMLAEALRDFAARQGLDISAVHYLGGYANHMFRLEPFDLVARVTGSAGRVRRGSDWLEREVDVCNHLRAAGASAMRPWQDIPPGPYAIEDQYFTLWEYAEVRADQVGPVECGDALRHLHEALVGYDGDLPEMGALNEAWAMIEAPATLQQLSADERAIIIRAAGETQSALSKRDWASRPLHGDAHYGNLWPTENGLIWGDFEDSHAGPVEWDLACLCASSIVLGTGEAARQALHAYRSDHDRDLLDLLITARTVQALAWAAVTLPDAGSHLRFQRRIEWLEWRPDA